MAKSISRKTGSSKPGPKAAPPPEKQKRRTKAVEAAPTPIEDYRHSEKRKNNPPAGLAARGKLKEAPRTRFSYDPHLPPILRFDPTGAPDRLPELLATARKRALTSDEAQTLAEALRQQQPWLEWGGKREKRWFEVDPVALHIHERVSAQAILKLAAREPIQRTLFADPELEYRQAVQFYQHDVDWANRLILGDSLVVLNSLARREDLAGKVQMIYVDPPYGIKFASNFQSQVGKHSVKEKEADLTREPEQVKAYRDTWTLGVHSYLGYLRDRLMVARELLTDTGSIFVQISDENVHRVRMVMDEVFGADNFIVVIAVKKTGLKGSRFLDSVFDYVLWYAKDQSQVKYQSLLNEKLLGIGKGTGERYDQIELPNGERRVMSHAEKEDPSILDNLVEQGAKPHQFTALISESSGNSTTFEVNFQGKTFFRTNWKTNVAGFERLMRSERIAIGDETLRYVRYLNDFPANPIANFWDDIGLSNKIYVVQTATKVIERCLLMTTQPGDLVLDPTCGSGTTAYVAEQWGRRWITIDTSRVAVALARQRLLTARFDYYELQDIDKGVGAGFKCKTVPHIMLKSITQNQALDPIFAKWEPLLAEKLTNLNAALAHIAPETRNKLKAKLAVKERTEGKRAINEADQRRWLLPAPVDSKGTKRGWQEWEVPYDTDPDWPEPLQTALMQYRAAWRTKMDEVNACIQASAPQETLVDQPHVVNHVLRVSGPFTVEGVQPIEQSLEEESPIDGAPEELTTFSAADEPANAEAYIDKMLRLLRQDGVRFPNNKVQSFQRLEPMAHSILHAEGEWGNGEGPRSVAISFGPQYGPISAKQVEDCLHAAARRGYDDLVFAGFTFDGAAQAAIQEDPDPQVRCHLAHIRPDVNMGDLLKDTPGSQLFTVFGQPRIQLKQHKSGEWVVEMEGVDIYDPVENTIHATNAGKVAAWFLDSDYDGRTFCITQAFFPDASAWEKLARALKSVVDEARFAAFSGTRSLPFEAGQHQRIAVKVIDPRGNEVMAVRRLTNN